MNKTTKNTLLYALGIPVVISLLSLASNGPRDFWAVTGLIFLGAALIFFFLGLLLVLIRDTRQTGQGLLLSGLIIFLVGFSICSTIV